MQDPNNKQNDNAWVAPLLNAIIKSPPLGQIQPITCPVCDCDHQQYQGSGVLSPSKDGTKLTCAFPTAGSLVQIDVPPDLPIKGTTLYVRYLCLCGGHNWAVVSVFEKMQTLLWCCELKMAATTKCKSGKHQLHFPPPVLEDEPTLQQLMDEATGEEPEVAVAHPSGLPVAPAVAAPGNNPIGDLLSKLGFNSGHPPLIVISPELLKEMNPAAFAQLQSQIGAAVQPTVQTVPVQQNILAAKESKTDHENPLELLAPKMPMRYMNWSTETNKTDTIGVLPTLPAHKPKVKQTPPYRCVGAADEQTLSAMTKWLFTLCIELRPILQHLYAFVYWNTTLLIVLENGADKISVLKSVSDAIVGMGALKPTSLHPLTRKDYETLRKFKAAKATGQTG